MSMEHLVTGDFWQPTYPKAQNQKIEFSEEILQTMVVNERAGLSVNNVPLDSPACFCTASGDLYARLNWGHWCMVSKSNPKHVAAIRAAHYCRITLSLNNEIKDFVAPVFHVRELPRELFGSSADPFRARRKKAAIAELKCSMPEGVDAMAFTGVVLDNEKLDLVVSSDDDSIVFKVFPEDDVLSALPIGVKQEGAGTSANGIASDLLDNLVRQRGAIEKEGGPDTTVRAAIIAGPDTLSSMRDTWNDELVKRDIDLVVFSDFANYVKKHMPLLEEEGEEEEVIPASSATPDDDDEEEVQLLSSTSVSPPFIENSPERMEEEVKEIQVAVDAQMNSCEGCVLTRFRPETLTVGKSFPFDILLVGGHCLVAVYLHVPGKWLAEESEYVGNPPIWFSELEHMVSPVYYGQACRDFFNGKIADLRMGVIVILSRHSSIINEDAMLDCWHEGCHASVVRARSIFNSKLPTLRQCLSSLPESEAKPPQIDSSIILDLADEFASTFCKAD